MKTSNYILIAIFILVIVCILTFFITAKQNEHFFDKSEILLSDTIKVIVAESNTNFDIRSSDRNILLWNNSIKGTAIYYISNDTLFLNVAAFSPVIMLNHSVSILGEKDNAIVINDYKANRLTVKKTGGNLAMLRNTIDTLQIQATDNATVYLFNANRIEHLSVDMRNGSTFDHGNNSKIGTMNVTIDNQ